MLRSVVQSRSRRAVLWATSMLSKGSRAHSRPSVWRISVTNGMSSTEKRGSSITARVDFEERDGRDSPRAVAIEPREFGESFRSKSEPVRKWVSRRRVTGQESVEGQASCGLPLPGPAVGLVDARNTEEPTISTVRPWCLRLTDLLATEDEPAPPPLEHDDLPLSGLVQETEPLSARLGCGDLLHTYSVQVRCLGRQRRASRPHRIRAPPGSRREAIGRLGNAPGLPRTAARRLVRRRSPTREQFQEGDQ